MKSEKTSKKLAGVGIISAIAASLCCITPVLALISGASGAATTFSWMEPFRPYLIGITVLVLSFAWYLKLNPREKEIECDCEKEKPSFLQSKLFMGIITVFAVLMLAFPYYSHIFYPEDKQNVIGVDSKNVQKVYFEIEGMTCQSCEEIIKHEVNKLNGIISTKVSYEESSALIEFDSTKISLSKIVEAINSTSYSVKSSSMKK